MASDYTFVFSQPSLPTCSFSMFHDMKKKGKLSDVSIRIDDLVFAAHRLILAAAIPYFGNMFNSCFVESREKEVTMTGLDPAALELLIDFAYTSKVEITVENVQPLLFASEYLQLTKIRDSCCNFLSKTLNPTNVMNIREFAESLNCLSLVKNADSYIRENFEAFSQTKEFLSLSFQFLNDLIRKDDLLVLKEEIVYDAVIKWVKTYESRHKMLPDLLSGVRMVFLTPQFLIKKASKEKLIMDSVLCKNLLDEAKHYHLLPEEGASGCSFKVSKRCYGQSAGCGIYLFCCSEASGLTIFKYKEISGKWNTLLTDEDRCDLQHVIPLDDWIYVFRSDSFETFNPRTLSWTSRASFPRGNTQCSFKHVVACNGKIYWFGNSHNLHEGVYFDDQADQWVTFKHPNFRTYSDDELVAFRNNVCIFGSRERSRLVFRENFIYSLHTLAVTQMPQMGCERYAFESAVLGDKVYACGGIESPLDSPWNALRDTEFYDASGRWHTAPSMTIARKNFSLLAYKKKLYAIGGTKEASNFVEIYDPGAYKWTHAGGCLGDDYDFVKAVAISSENNCTGR